MSHFRGLLKAETARLSSLCATWESKVASPVCAPPEEAVGQIRAAVGKARLLYSNKGRFQQFGGLVDDCELNRGEKKTTCTDLQVRQS